MNVKTGIERTTVGYNGFSLPIPVDEIISDCIGVVSQHILPQLQAADSNIQSLSFMFGHPVELKNTLKEMSESATQRYLKFPVVMLFSDVVNSPASVKGCYNDVTLNIVIAMSTQPEYNAAKRALTNFDPILRPIYYELIKQIYKCGYFWIQSPSEITGRNIERFFWGRESIQGNDANKFNDYIDAIEIRNLKLTQSKRGTTVTQNTFMQLVEYFLSQTRATIVIGAVASNTITHAFFTSLITEITTNAQDYIAEVDFTQTLDGDGVPTGAIVGVNIEFYAGQTIIAKR